MEKEDLKMFETYQKLMYHFYIYMDVHNARGNVKGMKVWADYLFPVLDDAPQEVQFLISDVDINQKMTSSGHKDIILEEDDDIYKKGDRLKSFHRQAKYPISRKVILAGFLSVWLKKCIVLSPTHVKILLWVLLPLYNLLMASPLDCFPHDLLHPTWSSGIDRSFL